MKSLQRNVLGSEAGPNPKWLALALGGVVWLGLAGMATAIEPAWYKAKPKIESSDAVAQFELGRRFEHGIGVKPDIEKAIRWYRSAAEQYLAQAQYSMGRLCAEGHVSNSSMAQAVTWFRLAAEQGYAPAQNRLGRLYETGLGISKDVVSAYLWYSLAAADGRSATALVNRQILASRMTPAQLAQAELRVASQFDLAQK